MADQDSGSNPGFAVVAKTASSAPVKSRPGNGPLTLRFIVTYYNTRRPHRSLQRTTPATAYGARPKLGSAGTTPHAHFRVRKDKIDPTRDYQPQKPPTG
ncbi:MAG: hypothetical protein WCI74_02760 [Actinomycetes bacterium]